MYNTHNPIPEFFNPLPIPPKTNKIGLNLTFNLYTF